MYISYNRIMDYYVNSKSEQDTIYEIYKSCRLCGAGAGYKMPIIQNVINLDSDEAELKQKIRECVQIEVHQDDKMPPLICELCVDKVNDFYEFLEMCKQTNKKTRLRLGLPPQTIPQGAPDAGDCILGVTEPVFINQNSSESVLSSSTKTTKVIRIKKEFDAKGNTKFRKKDETKTQSTVSKDNLGPWKNLIKDDSKKAIDISKIRKTIDSKISRLTQSKKDDSRTPKVSKSLRSGRSRQPSPPTSPARALRGTKRPSEDNISLGRLQNTKAPVTQSPKSILKKVKVNANDLLEPQSKRTRDSPRESLDMPKNEQNKKVKITLTIPKIKVEPQPVAPSPPPSHKCNKCKNTFKTPQALASHMNTHVKVEKVERPRLAPPPKPEPKPKLQKCNKCDKSFLANLFKSHKCSTKHECKYCKRKFSTMGTCTNHEKWCRHQPNTITVHHTPTHQKKPKIPQWLKSQLLPMEVRLARCDSLCDENGHCRDACFVDHDYGLDKRCEYPYLYNLSMLQHKLRIKSELAMYDHMVKIQDEVKDEFDLDECYMHWDSASESESDTEMYRSKPKSDVKRLSTLSLKVLFSPQGLGKVPKKLRKVKSEKPFDSILNSTEVDSDNFGISKIINSLEDSINENDNTKDYVNDTYKSKDDTLFGENKGPGVKNSDFDLLFGNSGSTDCDKDKISHPENVESGTLTLDLSDVNNRLSESVGDANSSSGGNVETSVENDSPKSESGIDRISSTQVSFILSPKNSMTLKKDVEENDKNVVDSIGDIKNNDKSTVDADNSNSTESKILEDKTKVQDKYNESIADNNNSEDDRINIVVDTAAKSNQETEIRHYSKKPDGDSANNAKVLIENIAQNSTRNGDSELSEKFDTDNLDAVSDTDMDDGKLMEAIDAQLGEGYGKKATVTDKLSSNVHQEFDDFTKDIEY